MPGLYKGSGEHVVHRRSASFVLRPPLRTHSGNIHAIRLTCKMSRDTMAAMSRLVPAVAASWR